MADRYYSANVGADLAQDVTEGAAATPAAHFDLRITYDAAQNSKEAALKALGAIAMYITQDTWPPA